MFDGDSGGGLFGGGLFGGGMNGRGNQPYQQNQWMMPQQPSTQDIWSQQYGDMDNPYAPVMPSFTANGRSPSTRPNNLNNGRGLWNQPPPPLPNPYQDAGMIFTGRY